MVAQETFRLTKGRVRPKKTFRPKESPFRQAKSPLRRTKDFQGQHNAPSVRQITFFSLKGPLVDSKGSFIGLKKPLSGRRRKISSQHRDLIVRKRGPPRSKQVAGFWKGHNQMLISAPRDDTEWNCKTSGRPAFRDCPPFLAI